MTAISGVKAVIGGGGDFSAPIFRQQAKTTMQECDAGSYTVFMAIALNTDFRPDSRTFLRCSLTGKKGVERFTGMSYNAVDRNIAKLVQYGWVTAEEKPCSRAHTGSPPGHSDTTGSGRRVLWPSAGAVGLDLTLKASNSAAPSPQ